MHKHKQIGDWGEGLAQAHFEKQGYALVARQWKQRGGEIDLIMRRGDEVLFIEVKTRRPDNQSSAGHDIHPAQIRRQARLIESYVVTRGIEEWRCLLVCITTTSPPALEVVELTEALEAE